MYLNYCTITLVDANVKPNNRYEYEKALWQALSYPGVIAYKDKKNLMDNSYCLPYKFEGVFIIYTAARLEHELNELGLTIKIEEVNEFKPLHNPFERYKPISDIVEETSTYMSTSNSSFSPKTIEHEELQQYLRGVFEIEKQCFTLREIANSYETEIDTLHDEYNTIYFNEPILGDEGINRRIVESPSCHVQFGQSYMEKRYNHVPQRWELNDKTLEEYIQQFTRTPLFRKSYVDYSAMLDCEERRKNIANFHERHFKEDLEKKRTYLLPICEKTINEVEQVFEILSTSEKLREQLYDQNIIHPKYRNLLAIAQILEYFETGRCTELGGPNGAYNLYEQELRQDIIIDELDQVIKQLEHLNRTMSYVASAINQTNILLEDISSTLGRIEANTALTAYNSQCIAHNTRIANQYVL